LKALVRSEIALASLELLLERPSVDSICERLTSPFEPPICEIIWLANEVVSDWADTVDVDVPLLDDCEDSNWPNVTPLNCEPLGPPKGGGPIGGPFGPP
jgi:hypothetical protein